MLPFRTALWNRVGSTRARGGSQTRALPIRERRDWAPLERCWEPTNLSKDWLLLALGLLLLAWQDYQL